MKDKYINDIEPIIRNWLKSGKENTTMIAYEIAEYIRYEIAEYVRMQVKNNSESSLVSNNALQNNNKLIDNMCISYRHDFGLMKEKEKNELRFQCKEWLRAYENNREHCC